MEKVLYDLNNQTCAIYLDDILSEMALKLKPQSANCLRIKLGI